MKKYISLLLAMLFLSMTACGGPSANGNTGGQSNYQTTEYESIVYELADDMSTEEKIDAVSENCIGFLQVEINPAFELYLTPDHSINELRVLGVNTLNTDADLLFKNLAVSGMTLYDALFSILDTAREKGFLTDGGNIGFEAVGNLGTFEPEDLLRFMMIGYQEEKSISFSYNVTYTHLGVNNNLFVDEDLHDTVEKDGNGNIVKTVKLDTENNIEMTCIYSTTGELITEIFNDKNNKEYHEKHYDKGKTGKKLYQ